MNEHGVQSLLMLEVQSRETLDSAPDMVCVRTLFWKTIIRNANDGATILRGAMVLLFFFPS